MTPAHSEEESHPQDSDTEVEELEPPSSPYTPDLSTISSGGLRKLTENVVAAIEGHDGSLYHPLYRQLQVKPAKYYDFNNGVVRHIRNKHFVDIKRGSDASIKSISGLVLRGFGHEVWRAGSDWLLEDKDLDEGEVRIVYDRRKLEDPDPRYGKEATLVLSKTNEPSLQILQHTSNTLSPNAERDVLAQKPAFPPRPPGQHHPFNHHRRLVHGRRRHLTRTLTTRPRPRNSDQEG